MQQNYCEYCGRSNRQLATICLILYDLLQNGFSESQCLQILFVLESHLKITRKDLERMEEIISKAIEYHKEEDFKEKTNKVG